MVKQSLWAVVSTSNVRAGSLWCRQSGRDNGYKVGEIERRLETTRMRWNSTRIDWSLWCQGYSTEARTLCHRAERKPLALELEKPKGGSRTKKRSCRLSCCFMPMRWIGTQAKLCVSHKMAASLLPSKSPRIFLMANPNRKQIRKGTQGNIGQIYSRPSQVVSGVWIFWKLS